MTRNYFTQAVAENRQMKFQDKNTAFYYPQCHRLCLNEETQYLDPPFSDGIIQLSSELVKLVRFYFNVINYKI